MRVVDHKCLEQLRLNLLSIDHHCAILQQLIPSCEYLKDDHTYCRPMNRNMLDLKCLLLLHTRRLKRYLELTVFLARRSEIEFLTRQQTETPLWYEVCARHITGSKSEKILCLVTRKDELLKSILYLQGRRKRYGRYS